VANADAQILKHAS